MTAPASAFGLPFRLDRFVGREDELPELERMLGRAHLLTLVGAPGVGKTRLALQLAQRYACAEDHRVLWVDVANASQALLPTGFLEFLAEVRDEHVLVVLDGCSDSRSLCRLLTDAVLREEPRTKLLATSRERLGAAAEVLWLVAPLAVPPADADDRSCIAQNPAVSLFVARAQLANPKFALTEFTAPDVARLCRATDGVPLAIELAAAECAFMTPRAAVEHVDWFLGHRVVVASLERTIRQLTPDQRQFLSELSVFPASWDIHAAEAVCTISGGNVLPLLTRLVTCSLVHRLEDQPGREVRYAIANNLIRRYAEHTLKVTNQTDDIGRKHALWYHRVAESAVFGSGEAGQVDSLRSEVPNFLTALAWAIDAGQADVAPSFAKVLHGLWYLEGNSRQARNWLERILALPGGSNASRALVMNWAGLHAMADGDSRAAFAWSARARELAKGEQDSLLRAIVLDGLATLLFDQGSLGAAEAVTSDVLHLCAASPLDWLESTALCRHARIQLELGQLQVAQLLAEHALSRLRETNNEWLQLRIRQVLGRIALERQDWMTASEHLAEALSSAHRIHDSEATLELLIDQSRLEFRRGKTHAARQLVAQTFDIKRGISALSSIHRLEVAVVISCRVRPEAAFHLAGAVRSLRDGTRTHRLPREDAHYRSSLALARGHIRRATARAALTAGRRLDRDSAVILARDLLEAAQTSEAHSHSNSGTLTMREVEIATLLSRGLTNRAIASELFITEGTVRAHVEHILGKLGVRSRVEVAARLRSSGVASGD